MADWIMQANLKLYDLHAAVAASQMDTWSTLRYRSEITVGDRAWLQIVGPRDPGIYYIASITSVPYETSESEFGHWRSDIRYDFRVEPPLLRVEARADPVLADFVPLRGFQGTLARGPNEIVARLEQLTEGRRVPLDRAGPAAHEVDVNRAIELHNLVV